MERYCIIQIDSQSRVTPERCAKQKAWNPIVPATVRSSGRCSSEMMDAARLVWLPAQLVFCSFFQGAAEANNPPARAAQKALRAKAVTL